MPVFERKGCDNKETVFETVADVITEHVKQWIFVSKNIIRDKASTAL